LQPFFRKKPASMGKLTAYNIVLKDLTSKTTVFDYELDNSFFEKIDDSEIRRGKVKASVTVTKIGEAFDLDFVLEGSVSISCNRCLDDMEQPIAYKSKLTVRFGQEFAEDKNNVVIVPATEGEINIAWFLFEFIALDIPIKHIHAPGKCNKAMMSKLRKHSVRDADSSEFEFDEEENNMTDTGAEENIDPRWDELKKLKTDND
jgi:uncharacterized metal-binding protein YceD (DUF177 family)